MNQTDPTPPPAAPPTGDAPPPGSPGGPGGPYAGGPYAGGPSAGGPGRPAGTLPGAGFFDQIRGLGIVRPDDRVAAGVGAGVARRLGIDPLLVRVGFVVLTVLGGVGILAYGLGWLLLPQEDGRIHAQALLSGSVTAGTVGSGLTVLLGIGGFGPPWDWGWGDGAPGVGGLVALASIVLVIVLVVVGQQQHWFDGSRGPAVLPGPGWSPGVGATAGERVDLTKDGGAAVPTAPRYTPTAPRYTGSGPAAPVGRPPMAPPAPPRPPRPPRRPGPGALGTLLAIGLALLAAGTMVVLDPVDGSDQLRTVAWATGLAVLALALVVLGLLGRRSGGVGPLAVIALVITSGLAVTAGNFDSDDTGSRSWAPTGARDDWSYDLSAGDATLDLGGVRPGTGPVDVEADVSLGELTVRVPDDLTVELDVTNGVGDVTGAVEGRSTIGPAGSPDVFLSVDVSVGSLVVQEVSR